jgi:hypothetical protein
MPLVKTDYTITKAIEIVAEFLPGENPKSALLDAFRTGEVKAYVTSNKDGRPWAIEPYAWGSKDFDFDWDTGQANYRIRGLVEPVRITGPVYVKRDSLDHLLQNVNGSAGPTVEQPTEPPPRSGRGGKTPGPYYKQLENFLKLLKDTESKGEEYLENVPLKAIRQEFNMYAEKNDPNQRWHLPGRSRLDEAIKEILKDMRITRR